LHSNIEAVPFCGPVYPNAYQHVWWFQDHHGHHGHHGHHHVPHHGGGNIGAAVGKFVGGVLNELAHGGGANHVCCGWYLCCVVFFCLRPLLASIILFPAIIPLCNVSYYVLCAWSPHCVVLHYVIDIPQTFAS